MPRGGKREGAGRASAFGDEETKPAAFKLPLTLLDELKAFADAGNTTQAAVVALALRAYLDANVSPPGAGAATP